MLPIEEIINLNLKSEGFINCLLGNGRKEKMELFKAELDWFGDKKKLKVISSELSLPLIGMKLLSLVKTTLDPSNETLTIEKSN